MKKIINLNIEDHSFCRGIYLQMLWRENFYRIFSLFRHVFCFITQGQIIFGDNYLRPTLLLRSCFSFSPLLVSVMERAELPTWNPWYMYRMYMARVKRVHLLFWSLGCTFCMTRKDKRLFFIPIFLMTRH